MIFPTRIAGKPVHSESVHGSNSGLTRENSLIDSRDFHDLESKQLWVIPRSQSSSICSELLGKLCCDCSRQLDTRNLCSMPGNVSVDPSAPDETTASSLRHVHARNPTATYGETVFSSTRRHVARIDEINTETQGFMIPTPRFAGSVPTWKPPSFAEEVYSRYYMVGQPTNEISELHFDKFPTPSSFSGRRTSFKTEVRSGSGTLSEAIRRIKEVDVATYVDHHETSQSIRGHRFPNFEMLDTKIASPLWKINQYSNFKKRVHVAEQKAQLDDRFSRGRHIAFMTYEYFWVTSIHEAMLWSTLICSM